VRGISKHQAAVSFTARQILDMTAPCNIPFLNPEIAEDDLKERGANLARGASNYRETSGARCATSRPPASKPSASARTWPSPPARSSTAIT
jgi:polyhydroxyalkanoate synthase